MHMLFCILFKPWKTYKDVSSIKFFYVIYPNISFFDKCGIKNLEYLHDSIKSKHGDRMMKQSEDECKCF